MIYVMMGGIIYLFLIAPGKASKKKKAPFYGHNIAHRGLYRQDQKIPENSLAAFKEAVKHGYGIELDLQLSKDGYVVVFHDGDLNRMCAMDRQVEDCFLDELQSFSLKETDEKIPLFADVLDCVKGKVPLIVELKSIKNYQELCDKTYELLKDYQGDYCVESFSPLIVAYFRKHAPHILRGQLSQRCSSYKKNGFPLLLRLAISRTLFNFLCRPQFIAYEIGSIPFNMRLCRLLGAMSVGWTSHDQKNEDNYDCVIFEYDKPKTIYKTYKK